MVRNCLLLRRMLVPVRQRRQFSSPGIYPLVAGFEQERLPWPTAEAAPSLVMMSIRLIPLDLARAARFMSARFSPCGLRCADPGRIAVVDAGRRIVTAVTIASAWRSRNATEPHTYRCVALSKLKMSPNSCMRCSPVSLVRTRRSRSHVRRGWMGVGVRIVLLPCFGGAVSASERNRFDSARTIARAAGHRSKISAVAAAARVRFRHPACLTI